MCNSEHYARHQGHCTLVFFRLNRVHIHHVTMILFLLYNIDVQIEKSNSSRRTCLLNQNAASCLSSGIIQKVLNPCVATLGYLFRILF